MSASASTAPAPAIQKVFVYGSLLADDVVQVLLNRVPQSTAARLPNYHRYNVKGRLYPAIAPLDKKEVLGRVLRDITIPELQVLDAFEDIEYERRIVQVQLTDSLEELDAYTYVWMNADDPQLYGSWDFEDWKVKHMDDFLKMTCGFVAELEEEEPKSRVQTYDSYFQK